jgi:hypothetical protein
MVPTDGASFPAVEHQTFGELSPPEDWLYRDLVEDLGGGKSLASQIVAYPADGVGVLTAGLNWGAVTTDLSTLRANVIAYLAGEQAGELQMMADFRSDRVSCSTSRFVVVGYSQGAMVVHNFLNTLARSSDSSDIASIAGAVLIADPERNGNSSISEAGGAPRSQDGLCPWTTDAATKLNVARCNQPDVSSVFKPVTTEVCNADDIVCDFKGLWDEWQSVIVGNSFFASHDKAEIISYAQDAMTVHTKSYQYGYPLQDIASNLARRLP